MTDRRCGIVICVLFLALSAGCGTGSTLGEGFVTVDGLAPGQELLCGDNGQTIFVSGTGFLSEHGLEVQVLYTAVSGTPFDDGASATEEVTGTVLSDTELEVPLPSVNLGEVTVTITVILVGGNFGVSPEQELVLGGELIGPFAEFDEYDATGNVTLMLPAGTGLLANDTAIYCGEEETKGEKQAPGTPGRRATSLLVVDYDAITALGGTVQVNPDGSFTYQPPLGVGGTALDPVYDSFQYTIEQDGSQDVGFVEIAIREVVWFINDGVPPGGTGHFSDPLSSLPEFNAIQDGGSDSEPQEGDWIFVYEGAEPYDGGIRLLDNQKLIGQGVDLVVNGQTIVTATMNPELTNTLPPTLQGPAIQIGADCIVLADANRIDGVDVVTPTGNGIRGTDVAGPTTVDHTNVRGAGLNGVFLENECSGTFDFGTTVSVTDCDDTAVRIQGFGDFDEFVVAPPEALVFSGAFTYEGTISQTDSGTAIVVYNSSPGSTIVFQNGTVAYDGDTFSAIDLFEVQGSFTCTSPQTIEGQPFIGIYITSSAGIFAFSDTTIDVADGGSSSSGVEASNIGAASLTFTDLDITILGSDQAVAGGVGIRIGNLGGSTGQANAAIGVTSVTVNGTSTIDMTDAEEACILFGDVLSPLDLAMTFQSISVDGSPQTGGLFFDNCLGFFTVTGTTTITNYSSAGILFLGGDCDLTFATLNISNGTGLGGRGVFITANAGLFTASSGTVDNVTLEGVVAWDSNITLNNMACSNITVDVVELRGTCTISGSGNSATTFGNLCDAAGATVTGTIDFGAAGTCP